MTKIIKKLKKPYNKGGEYFTHQIWEGSLKVDVTLLEAKYCKDINFKDRLAKKIFKKPGSV